MLTDLQYPYEELVRTLHRYSASSSCHLVLRILVEWGHVLVDAGHFNTSRYVGTAFIATFDAERSIELSESDSDLSLHECESITRGFASQFAGQQFNDAMNAFVGSIHNWISSSTFDHSMHLASSTRAQVIRDMHKVWF